MNAYKVDAIRQSRRYTIVTENGLAILLWFSRMQERLIIRCVEA
jgi:hypothetical protein